MRPDVTTQKGKRVFWNDEERKAFASMYALLEIAEPRLRAADRIELAQVKLIERGELDEARKRSSVPTSVLANPEMQQLLVDARALAKKAADSLAKDTGAANDGLRETDSLKNSSYPKPRVITTASGGKFLLPPAPPKERVFSPPGSSKTSARLEPGAKPGSTEGFLELVRSLGVPVDVGGKEQVPRGEDIEQRATLAEQLRALDSLPTAQLLQLTLVRLVSDALSSPAVVQALVGQVSAELSGKLSTQLGESLQALLRLREPPATKADGAAPAEGQTFEGLAPVKAYDGPERRASPGGLPGASDEAGPGGLARVEKLRILIVGLLPGQQREIEQAYGSRAEVRFLTQDDSHVRMQQNARSCDVTIGMVGFLGHAAEKHLKKQSRDFRRCNGTLGELKRMLDSLLLADGASDSEESVWSNSTPSPHQASAPGRT